MTNIKIYCYIGLVATAIFFFEDCLSDAATDDSGTRQCYNIGGDEVCYFIGSEQLSEWHLAYEICEKEDSTLTIIRNATEQNVFEKYLKYLQMKRAGISFVWTAGKREDFNDWVWINGQPISDKVRRSMLSGNKADTHVEIMKNYSFGVEDPDFERPFLCQFYNERCLLSGRVKLTNSCVVISNFMASWFNARSDCLARGGDLAVLSDQDLQIFKNSSQQLPVYSVWIGLRIMSWFWQLDSEGKQTDEIKYKKWGRHLFTTSGDECIHIEAFSGKWIQTECSKKHSVICQIKGSTTIATTGDANALNQSTEPQSVSIGLMTFALTIAGVVLVCIAFSAIVGIIAARKASATKNSERNVCTPTNDYSALQLQSVYEDPNESRY